MGIFFSTPFFVAAFVGQWSPLLLAGAFLPALQVFMPCKPTIAAASFIARPSLKGLLYGVLITLISLLFVPGWPIDWLHNVLQQVDNHQPPVFGFPGILLLLGLAAWKKREAWILLWMAIVPQTPFFYDQMALWLIPKTRVQLRVLNIFSWLAFGVWFYRAGLGPMNEHIAAAEPLIDWLIFLPALGIVLWNELRVKNFYLRKFLKNHWGDAERPATGLR